MTSPFISLRWIVFYPQAPVLQVLQDNIWVDVAVVRLPLLTFVPAEPTFTLAQRLRNFLHWWSL